MKIKCIQLKLNDSQCSILGKNPSAKNSFYLTLNREYAVFGLTFKNGEFGNGCFVEILSDHSHLISVPLILFEIVDHSISKYWMIKLFPEGTITMWPPSMYREFYHDDLSEDVVEVVEDFKVSAL